MDHPIGFVFKLLILSTLLSFGIKYGAPYLAIAPTHLNALIGVLLPAGIMAIALTWSAWKQERLEK
ncbi:MAG: hypothetical protein HC772_15980 [Leptolyngbyaceae cyanobacterium CRU_2_3]|nr:hypothetical protein [Leptolyngbyaceae cyanobacterium CRU_2_3]